MIDEIQNFVSKFNSDPLVKQRMGAVIRIIYINIEDVDEIYYLKLKDGQLSISESVIAPDIRITTDRKTFAGLVNETIKVGEVYNKTLKIDAPVEDLLLMSRVLR